MNSCNNFSLASARYARPLLPTAAPTCTASSGPDMKSDRCQLSPKQWVHGAPDLSSASSSTHTFCLTLARVLSPLAVVMDGWMDDVTLNNGNSRDVTSRLPS